DEAIENSKENKYKIESQLNESKLYLYHEFNVQIDEILDKVPEKIDEKQVNQKITDIKGEIKNLGHVNLLAEELYDDVDKRYKFHVEQKEDLLKAQEDLLKIIDEVSKESEKIFLDTFENIRKNFHHLFRRIFGGGKADLILQDPKNVLESGIEINAQPPGKKINTYTWLSGGERSLLAVVLSFSIFLVKPSPFCVLDEIDAALDDQNNLKFLKLMREFAENTQFLIVSHNKQTIVNSDYLYGVTMEEKGISKVVSLELKKEKIDDYIK
ncbi:MAG: AAA family ATPase, partial [Spirochaetes bacterium]|nr:AAA family ATPase [Spirochaetota bacterium]